MFEQEKTHLRPISLALDSARAEISTLANSITRTVRKDNTILYRSNRYTVPLGTYTPFGKTVQVVMKEKTELWIYDPKTERCIGKHRIAEGKGKLIQNRNHLRDRTKGIDAYIERVAHQFEQPEVAKAFLAHIRKAYPRYMRDQLQLIQTQLAQHPACICSQALQQCMELRLYNASEFTDVIGHLQRQVTLHTTHVNVQSPQPLHEEGHSVLHAQAAKRNIEEYIHILEGKRK
ncbi:MAG: hypothetical protein KatS3mg080_0825 [Anoxybacillus sp.]|uniref:Transposase n=2 Tax=Anoxybacillaceae TaxID=3120669 RepID=R4FGB0_9BACL|nr:hypothetical protein [Anoxybacillus flavithermus]GAC91920.1 hypothetical protein KN10_2356 [Anoxybacillus flavithermus NBRC 109594]GIW50214.1 MAG: hypothetical protein KatS3mg080_0825 [Anoxybacillus sp.]